MKKIMAIALAAMLVIGCSFSAWATVIQENTDTSGTYNVASDDTLVNNGTSDGETAGIVNENEGAITNNNAKGTVTTNNGTVTTNNGTIGDGTNASTGNKGTVNSNSGTICKNHGTGTVNTNTNQIQLNIGKVEKNDGTIINNHNGGFVETNNKQITTNWGQATVVTNATGGIITNNNGTVTTNNGTIKTNAGTVETNTLKGSVSMYNDGSGIVEHNYGTVTNAGTASGEEVSGYGSKTYYGVTYYDDSNEKSNEQVEANARITIQTAEKDGYKLVKWTVTTPAGAQSYYYTVGQEVDVTSPLQLEAVWEAIKRKSSGSSSKANYTYFGTGTKVAPAKGNWNKNIDGSWNFGNSGIAQFTNTWGYIQHANSSSSDWYFFDTSGNMLKGLQTINGKTYYLRETADNREGAMETGWQLINGLWRCFGADGAMLTNTTTSDGYKVDANGVWIQG